MGQASQVAYYEYPFHALPDLGLVNRAHFPFEYFGGEATKLTAEEMKIIRSGYLWAQTYGVGLVPSTQTSYSELWFIFQYIIRQMQLFCSVSWIDEAKEKSLLALLFDTLFSSAQRSTTPTARIAKSPTTFRSSPTPRCAMYAAISAAKMTTLNSVRNLAEITKNMNW